MNFQQVDAVAALFAELDRSGVSLEEAAALFAAEGARREVNAVFTIPDGEPEGEDDPEARALIRALREIFGAVER